MKDFYENVVLQLLFNKNADLIKLLKIFSYISHKKIIWDPATTNKSKNKKLGN